MTFRRKSLAWIFLIAILALTARLALVGLMPETIDFPDERDYDTIARSLVKGTGFQEADGRRAGRAPGYPVFLAALYLLGLDTPRAVFIIQAFCGTLTCVLLCFLAKKLFGGKTAAFAGLIAALYPFFIYFTGLLLSETLFILFLVAFFLLLETRSGPGLSWPRRLAVPILAGILAGVLTHLRSSFLLFPFFLLPFVLLRRKPRRNALAGWALMLLFMALTLSPWVWRNYRLFGHFIPTTLQAGESLYEANSPYATGGPAMNESQTPWDRITAGQKLNEYERDRFFRDKAIKYIREHPGRFAQLALIKLKRFWNPIPNYRHFRSPLYIAISLSAYLPVILLALCGLIRNRSHKALLLYSLSPVFYYTALHAVFVGSVRYRIPVMAFVILLAGAGAAVVVAWVRTRIARLRQFGWKRWGALLMLILCLYAVYAYRKYTNPERIRLLTQSKLTEIIGLPVKINAAHFHPHTGLVLRGVRIRQKDQPVETPLLGLTTVLLRPDWTEIFRGRIAWRAVEIEDLELNASLDAESRRRLLQQLETVASAARAHTKTPGIYISRIHARISGLEPELGGIPDLDLHGLNADLTPGEKGNLLLKISSEDRDLGRPSIRLRLDTQARTITGAVSLRGFAVDSDLREKLPRAWRVQWDIYSPIKARLDVDGTFSWEADREAPLHFEVDLSVRDGAFVHPLLPYPIRNLRCDAHLIDRSFRVSRIEALAGKALLSGSGSGQLSDTWQTTGQFTVQADDLALTPAIGKMLSGELKNLWERARPEGTISVQAHIRVEQETAAPDIVAEIKLTDGACSPRELPAPLKGITGRVKIADNRLNIIALAGRIGAAEFVVNHGVVFLETDGPFRLEATLRGKQLAGRGAELTAPPMTTYIPRNVREMLRAITYTGDVDARVSVERTQRKSLVEFHGDLTLNNTSINHAQLAHPFSDISGKLTLKNNVLTINRLSGHWGKANISIADTPKTISIEPQAAIAVTVNLKNLLLDKTFIALLPTGFRETLQTFTPSGLLDIQAILQRPAGKDKTFTLETITHIQNGRMVFTGFPYPVTAVKGILHLVGDELRKGEFLGRNGKAHVSLSLTNAPFNGKPGRVITVRGRRGTFNADLRGALPAPQQQLWDAVKPEGGLDLLFVKHFQREPWNTDLFQIFTEVELDDFALTAGEKISIPSGKITVAQCTPQPDGSLLATGSITLSALRIMGMETTDVHGKFIADKTGTHLRQIKGRFYGGKLAGKITFDDTPEAKKQIKPIAQGVISLNEADATLVAKANDLEQINGRLNLTGTFQGHIIPVPGFNAEGTLSVKDGDIGKLPGILSLLNFMRLRGLGAPAFHTMQMDFQLSHGDMRAKRLDLLGKTLTLHGHGIVRKNKTLNFRFIPELVHEGNIPLIGATLNFLKDKIIPLTLTGTTDNPQWQFAPPIPGIRIVPTLIGSAIDTLNPFSTTQKKTEDTPEKE